MDLLSQFGLLLPQVCDYVESHEEQILNKGIPLNADQKIDAYQIGVTGIEKVRIMKVDKIPLPSHPMLRAAVSLTNLVSLQTAGITFRYGIYIRSDCWNKRRLLVHELTHTMQYERIGGTRPFLERYLKECLTVGYPNGSMELEAIEMERKICD